MNKHNATTLASAFVLALGISGAGWLFGSVSGATASQPTTPTQRIAHFDMLDVLESEIARNVQFRDAREAEIERIRGRGEAISNDLGAIQQEIAQIRQTVATMTADNPEFPPLQQRFEALQNEYQVKLNELREFEATGLRELDELAAAQARETYERIVRAGVRVAQDRGYTHLVISRGNAPISERADNLNAVTQEILARLILIAPEGDNLTAAVRVDLGLPPTRDEEELEVQLDLTPGAPGGGG